MKILFAGHSGIIGSCVGEVVGALYNTYIIRSTKNGKYYIGSTENVEKRLSEHNSDNVRSTKNKGPYKLIYKEEVSTRTEARKRENQIKRFKGDGRFKELIA